MTMRILVLGAGYSGARIATRMTGVADSVAGTTQDAEGAKRLAGMGLQPIVFDGQAVTTSLARELARTSHLIVSIAPGNEGDPVLGLIGKTIRSSMPHLEWIGYLSTVGVYGDHKGAWVDEESACRPVSRRSVRRLAIEQEWCALSQDRQVPIAIARLSGIYGPGRNALVNLTRGTARRLVKPGQVFNRIHVDDIAGALDLLCRQEAAGLYNISDDEPAPPQDVVAYAARLMDVVAPPEKTFEAADLSPMARSFYGENKRVLNRRIKELGLVLRYPGYRYGLEAMWSAGNWRLP